jgi:hypothetical protein
MIVNDKINMSLTSGFRMTFVVQQSDRSFYVLRLFVRSLYLKMTKNVIICYVKLKLSDNEKY